MQVDPANNTLMENPAQKVNLTPTNLTATTWSGKVSINTITGANKMGMVNLTVTATDTALNVAMVGLADPDGTVTADAGKIKDGTYRFEFDNWLNGGVAMPGLTAPAAGTSGFSISPNVGTAAAPKADIDSPFIRVDFENEATEYPVTLGAVTIQVDTHKGVTVDSATLTMPDATVVDVVADVKKIDDNSFVYAGKSLATGKYKLTVTASDEVGNISTTAAGTTATEFTYEFEVTEKAPFKLDVVPGLSMISIPMDPASTAIADALGSATAVDLVVTYDPANPAGPWLIAQRDPSSGVFQGSLTKIDARHGYWVRASSYTTVQFDLPRLQYQQQIPTIPVVKGWNLIPVVNLAQSAQGTTVAAGTYLANIFWNVAYTFDTMNNKWTRVPTDTVNVVVGSAYWVWATAAGNIVP